MNPLLRKLRHTYVLKRLLLERLTEPLHLNVLSVFALLGSFRTKVAFDLVIRQPHAYGLLKAADYAKSYGFSRITAVEFGVAAGAGLLNMASISEQVTRTTGIAIDLIGFDTGKGMPAPVDFRDHPDLYAAGDFPMRVEELSARLPGNVRLVLGPLAETIPNFLQSLSSAAPVGFVTIDVDYYSSTLDALKLFSASRPELYLPLVQLYVDDLEDLRHNSWCGELLAIQEFNNSSQTRKIEAHAFLSKKRVFTRAVWLGHMMQLHVLDHPVRVSIVTRAEPVVLENPYLDSPAG